PISCVQFSPDGRTLAASTGEDRGTSPGEVRLWDLAGRKAPGTLGGLTRGAASIAFSPDGMTIATAGADGVVRLWDAATHEPRNALKSSECHSVAFSPDGRWLASAHVGGDVVLWEVAGSRQVGLLKGHRDLVRHIAFAPDGGSLATAGSDRTVKVWS